MEKYRYDPAEFALMEKTTVPFAVYQFIDKRVVTLVLSAGFCELFGFEDRAEAYYVMDNDMYRDAHPDDVARIADAAIRFATENTEYNVVYRTFTHGAYRIVHAQGRHIYTDTGVRLAVVSYTDEGLYDSDGGVRDDTLNRYFSGALHEDNLYRSMNYDVLTGLPSMSYFFDLADAGRMRMQERGERVALLYIDLNGMKYFNRKYGFAEGDRLICAVAKTLARHFSNENCSRFGQDHFAVYTCAQGLEEKLNRIFEECGNLNEGKTLTLRVGVYLDRGDNVDVSTACDRAKVACDVERGAFVSSFHYFSESILAEAEKRQYIIDNLDRAIAENWIRVYYQPIVRAANGRVSDEESLARWIDPEKGLLSPAEFISILEDAKLIYKLDLYIVEQTLQKIKQQQASGLHTVPQSINLSRADFDSCDIVDEICRRVDAAGVPHDKLSIEITESVIGSDFDFIQEQISRFQSLGFEVWMDDFGSGYSSLDVLQSAHFDLIKFDMRFMQQFDNGDKSRIILTELIKMAIGLGIDTIAEGVETGEQVDFLREVGCTKLQGYYYCRPIPPEEILERNRKGIAIGYENPDEAQYYAALGRVNLYDLGMIASDDEEAMQHYFNTLPMAVLECTAGGMAIVRCNRSYREFMERVTADMPPDVRERFKAEYKSIENQPGSVFAAAIRRCAEDGGRVTVEETMREGMKVHALVRRIAVNPVTGIAACAVAVLSVTDERYRQQEVTYAHIAQALATDYCNLYYVNLDTERFIQYNADSLQSNLAVERHGADFFETSRRDAERLVFRDDQPAFLSAFTRENVLRALRERGAFTLTYRMLMDGMPVYMNMKITRMREDSSHIIIGVNNVDAQMKQQAALERIRAEQTTYSRVVALSGDYICIYTIDPKTGRYQEYAAKQNYSNLGLPREGGDFFEAVRKFAPQSICPDDLEMVYSVLTQEKVMETVREGGIFTCTYRLMINGALRYTRLKAALVEEKDGPQLIAGIMDIDDQIRREEEYAHNLFVARTMANIDNQTGVKNKKAYQISEERLDQTIAGQPPVRFAVVSLHVKEDQHAGVEDEKAGDRRIKQACAIICGIFKRSPVFRMDADSFAVIAQGHDYEHIDELIGQLDERNRENDRAGSVVVFRGMARYEGESNVAGVMERAARALAENEREGQ